METSRATVESGLDDELGWFVSDILLTLGMIGTVIGFIYMLGTSFQDFDPSNTVSLKQVLSKMGTGMSTALYTTAAGLVCSLFLKLQLFNLSHHLERMSARQDSAAGEKQSSITGETI
jgi:biopolymer transport protein ExbB/TolQ